MGEYIHRSPLIVIADIATSTQPHFSQVLTVREVIRGQAKVGDTLILPSSTRTRYIVPQQGNNVAVLLNANWQTSDMPVWEVYSKPEEIAALRPLVEIDDLPDERSRLLALRDRLSTANLVFEKQWLWEVGHMNQPSNFGIVLDSTARLDEAHQAELISLLGRINDIRALPVLTAALKSPSHKIRATAALTLTFYFPGAPGVTEGFQTLAQDTATQELAVPYLLKYAPTLAAQLPERKPTSWQHAQQLLKEEKKEQARDAFFALLENSENDWTRLSAAEALLPLLDSAGKERLRRLLCAYLAQETDSYINAERGIGLLRQLPHPDNVEVLLHLLHEPKETAYSSWDGASHRATFALLELGETAKQQATQRVREKIKTRLAPGASPRFNEETLYFCQLAWLADKDTWQHVLAELPAGLTNQMKALQPLWEAAHSPQEASELATFLPDTHNHWQGNSLPWIIARLGDLGNPLAVAPLVAEWERSSYSPDIKAALMAIGGAPAEAGALKLLQSQQDVLRAEALNILSEIQGEKARPLLRQILSDDHRSLSDKAQAAYLLGGVGTPDDLPLLLPLTNFWTTDHLIHDRAVGAVAQLRDRFGYDVNGPIGPNAPGGCTGHFANEGAPVSRICVC